MMLRASWLVTLARNPLRGSWSDLIVEPELSANAAGESVSPERLCGRYFPGSVKAPPNPGFTAQ